MYFLWHLEHVSAYTRFYKEHGKLFFTAKRCSCLKQNSDSHLNWSKFYSWVSIFFTDGSRVVAECIRSIRRLFPNLGASCFLWSCLWRIVFILWSVYSRGRLWRMVSTVLSLRELCVEIYSRTFGCITFFNFVYVEL